MGGLRTVCKMYGRLTVSSKGETVVWLWDYARDEPVRQEDMPVGSERWQESERARVEQMKTALAANPFRPGAEDF